VLKIGTKTRDALQRIDQRPHPDQWSDDELLSLPEAAALFWPDGPLTTASLHTAPRDGQLAVAKSAGAAAKTGVREAGHILMYVLFYGPDNVHATITAMRGNGGAAVRSKGPRLVGVYEDYFRRLQMLFAGRVAEETVFGSPSHGSGRTASPVIIVDVADRALHGRIAHQWKDVLALTELGRQGLTFIGATNDVRRCDPAIVGAGRLNRIINVRLPGDPDIEKMMRVRLHGDLKNEALEEMSLLAIGSSGADVGRIIKDARRQARQEERALSISDVRHAILGSEEELSKEELERAAIHEAGHIVVAVVHGGPADIHALVAGSRRSSGFVVSKDREPSAGTLDEYRLVLQGLLAGQAAEELKFGAAGSGAGGSLGSDLDQATRIAAAMVGSFGHAGPHPLLFLAERHRTDVIMNHAYLRAAVHRELAAALKEAKRILGEQHGALKEVAARLRSRGRIDGHEVDQVLADYSGNTQEETDIAGNEPVTGQAHNDRDGCRGTWRTTPAVPSPDDKRVLDESFDSGSAGVGDRIGDKLEIAVQGPFERRFDT
jgi:ATP-dependent Zn protease